MVKILRTKATKLNQKTFVGFDTPCGIGVRKEMRRPQPLKIFNVIIKD